jgi:general secretion pathway protein G
MIDGRNKSRCGFTLIEIMLVVIIIGALAAMIVPRLVGRSEQAKAAVAKSDLSNIATALKLYELDNGGFPTTGQGLSALREKSSAAPAPKSWNGPYLEKDPVDPWGNAYVYASPGAHRADYDLSSKGKDVNAADDDIVNWQ